MIKLHQLVGRSHGKNAEVLMIFKVSGKYFPADNYNTQVFETYLHTGDESYLQQLTNELEV